MSLNDWKTVADILQVIVTVGAVGLGGFWTYRAFVRTRQRFPRANVSQKLSHWPIDDTSFLVRVTVVVENVGDVLLSPARGFARVQQIKPWPTDFLDAVRQGNSPVLENETEVLWPQLCERSFHFENRRHEIEPHEADEFHFDFVVPRDAELLAVYTHIENAAKQSRFKKWFGLSVRTIGWNTTTVYALSKPEDKQ